MNTINKNKLIRNKNSGFIQITIIIVGILVVLKYVYDIDVIGFLTTGKFREYIDMIYGFVTTNFDKYNELIVNWWNSSINFIKNLLSRQTGGGAETEL